MEQKFGEDTTNENILEELMMKQKSYKINLTV